MKNDPTLDYIAIEIFELITFDLLKVIYFIW